MERWTSFFSDLALYQCWYLSLSWSVMGAGGWTQGIGLVLWGFVFVVLFLEDWALTGLTWEISAVEYCYQGDSCPEFEAFTAIEAIKGMSYVK